MPKRKQKGTDTEKEDSFEEVVAKDKAYTFGTIQAHHRFLPPDELAEEDPNRYSTRSWAHVLLAQKLLPWQQRKELFERAIKCLPYSYKIWLNYLSEYADYCDQRSLFSEDYKQLNDTFQRALKYLPKMPRLWILYAESLAKQNLVSKARQTYNWSFRNLPLSQHEKVWARYAPWTFTLSNSKTAAQVISRYLQLNPDFKENFADYLKERTEFDLCAKVIHDILKDEGYHSKQGKTKYDFTVDLIDLVVEEPHKIKSVNGQEVIRKAIQQFPDKSADFWVKLCSYFIRLGQFQAARRIFQQALNNIDNAKDFMLIFGAYCKFQGQMLMALKDESIRKEENVTMEDQIDQEIEQRLAKLESLIERRPYMLCNIDIRKQPNFVKFWLTLAQLHHSAGNIPEYLATLVRASETVKPEEAENGKLSEIWILHAKYYKQINNYQRFNELFLQGTRVNYRTVDDYISVWTQWCECLIEMGFAQDALQIIKHVLFKRRSANTEELKIKNIQEILKSSVRIWEMYIDLELEIGTFDSAKTAYKKCKDHKALNPLMLLNYVNMLWTNSYFEQVFRIFEYAVGEFRWPTVYEIWLSYVIKFIERYAQSPIGVQRTRSIFQRLLRQVPSNKSKIFYFIYAQFEQQYGLYSHAIEIYDRMINAVPEDQRYECYNIYIAKISQLLGVTKTRAVFEAALKNLDQEKIVLMALKYAELERNLNQVERARQVYSFASQFSDPKQDYDSLWKTWQEFQLAEGDRETFQQLLRVRRSVVSKFSMLPPDIRRIEENVKKGLL